MKKLNESYEIIENNIFVDFDKFVSGKNNVCLITGLSGSGKTTFATDLSYIHNATVVSLDHFYNIKKIGDKLEEIDPVLYSYLSTRKDLWKKLVERKLTGNNYNREVDKYLQYCIEYCKKNKHKKYIIEGVQLYCLMNGGDLKGCSLICMNTSAFKSAINRVKRINRINKKNGCRLIDRLIDAIQCGKIDKDAIRCYDEFKNEVLTSQEEEKTTTENMEVEPLEEVMVDNNPKYNEEDLTDHHGVGVVLLNEDMEILMLDHVKLNTEVFPVGKVKKGESVFEGMCNELFEETNLKINSAYEVVEFVLDIIRNGKKITQTNHIFICRDYSGNIKNKEPKKHRDVYFIPFEEMMKKNQNSYMVNVFKDAYRKGYIVLTENTTNCMIDRQSSVDEMIYRTKFIKHVRKGNKYV